MIYCISIKSRYFFIDFTILFMHTILYIKVLYSYIRSDGAREKSLKQLKCASIRNILDI